MAQKYDSKFLECSALNQNSVENVFHALIREIQTERELPLQTLLITEPFSPTGSLPKALVRRSKNSKSPSPKLLKKSSSTFKLFNKGFKIFS